MDIRRKLLGIGLVAVGLMVASDMAFAVSPQGKPEKKKGDRGGTTETTSGSSNEATGTPDPCAGQPKGKKKGPCATITGEKTKPVTTTEVVNKTVTQNDFEYIVKVTVQSDPAASQDALLLSAISAKVIEGLLYAPYVGSYALDAVFFCAQQTGKASMPAGSGVTPSTGTGSSSTQGTTAETVGGGIGAASMWGSVSKTVTVPKPVPEPSAPASPTGQLDIFEDGAYYLSLSTVTGDIAQEGRLMVPEDGKTTFTLKAGSLTSGFIVNYPYVLTLSENGLSEVALWEAAMGSACTATGIQSAKFKKK